MKTIERLLKESTAPAKGQRGAALAEALIALALLAVVGVTFIFAISSGYITLASVEKDVNVDNLARAQMEYTKNSTSSPYDSTHTPPTYQTIDQLSPGDPYTITLPPDYSTTVTAVALHTPDDGIQKITVTILRNGASLLSLDGYKVNR